MDWEGRLPLSSGRTGPFVSALTSVVLQLGQKPVPSQFDDSLPSGKHRADFGADEDYAKRARPNSGNTSRKSKSRSGKSRTPTTLKDLVDHGVIIPGRNKISVSYKGMNYVASLGKDGIIVYQGKKFSSATAFSIHCKRMQTPNKQGDDGWKSTLYEGQPLDIYRRKYHQETGLDIEDLEQDDVTEEQAPAAPQLAPVPQEAPAQPQEPAETDHWVQCDRCRTWRIVPDAAWPAVEADTRDSWFCEWATWDVRTQVPHNPPCMQRTA